jgi:hypothetical protein
MAKKLIVVGTSANGVVAMRYGEYEIYQIGELWQICKEGKVIFQASSLVGAKARIDRLG